MSAEPALPELHPCCRPCRPGSLLDVESSRAQGESGAAVVWRLEIVICSFNCDVPWTVWSFLIAYSVIGRMIRISGQSVDLSYLAQTFMQFTPSWLILFSSTYLSFSDFCYFARGIGCKVCDECICQRGYLRKHTRDLHQIFCACCPCAWLSPPACWR